MKKRKLSVIIPTKKEDLDLAEGAIQSVLWADEIILVDSSFSKESKMLGKKYGAKVLQHEYVYSAKQKNWAIPQAKYDWILLLDSDEIVTEKLAKNIRGMLENGEIENFEGYGIARKHFFFGKFLRWGGRYPLYNVRLFKKSCRYEDRDVHAHIILDKSQVKNIDPKNSGDILHFSDRSFSQFFERFNRYSTYQANYIQKVVEQGIEINWLKFFTNFYYFKAIMKDVWFFLPFAPFLRFAWMYFVRLGFLDGREGFTIALFYGFQDYVSKTKYKLKNNQEVNFRVKTQSYLMKGIVPAFLRKNKIREEFFNNKEAYISAMKTS